MLLAVVVSCAIGSIGLESGEPVRAQTDSAVSFPAWGETLLEGSFQDVLRVPGQDLLVARVDVADSVTASRLVVVDTLTLAVTEGPVLGRRVEEFAVSADGATVHVVFEGDSGFTVSRYSLPDMAVELTFEISKASSGGFEGLDELEAFSPMPGPDKAVVAVVGFEIRVYVDGQLLPDAPQFLPTSLLVALDESTVYGLSGNEVLEFAVDDDGIRFTGSRAEVNTGSSFRAGFIRGRLRIAGSLFDVPGLSNQTDAAGWENLGIVDEDLGLVYHRSGSILSTNIEFYDLDSGELITTGEARLFGELAGPGILVQRNKDGLLFINVPVAAGSYGEFTPVLPQRLFDTRNGTGTNGVVAPLGPRSTTPVQIAGVGAVPFSGIAGAVVNVTAIDLRNSNPGASFITVTPSGSARPTVSNVNFGQGEIVGNMVTVEIGDDGRVDLYNAFGDVDVTVDVMGYFATELAPPGARLLPYPERRLGQLGSSRLYDSRTDGNPLGERGRVSIKIPQPFGQGGRQLAADQIVGAVVNVTAVEPSAASFISVFGAGGSLPSSSSMNFPGRVNTARLITTNVGDDVMIEVFNRAGTTDVIVDLVGIYAMLDNDERGRYVPVNPERLIDTRESSPFDGDGKMTTDSILTLGGFGENIVLAANLAAVDPTDRGYLTATAFAAGEQRRFVTMSSLNYEPTKTVANHALVPTESGTIGVYHRIGRSHILLDVFGFYTGR